MPKLVLFLLILIVLLTRMLPLITGNVLDQETMWTLVTVKQATTGAINYTESPLLLYFLLAPYSLLKGFLSISETEYLIKGIFTVLSILLIYFLARRLGNERSAIITVILFATSEIAILIQGFNYWIGDFFSTIFLMISLVLLLLALDNIANRKRFLLLFIISLMSSIIATIVWNGGNYALVAYIFCIIALLINRRVKNIKEVLVINMLLIAVAYILYYPLSTYTGITFSSSISNVVVLLSQMSTTFFGIWFSGAGLNNFYLYVLLVITNFLTSTVLVLLAVCLFIVKNRNRIKRETFIVLIILFILAIPIALTFQRFNSLVVIPLVLLAGSSFSFFNSKIVNLVFGLLIVANFIAIALLFFSSSSIPNLSSQYRSTMFWIANNTNANATFLTFYLDGEPLEYWANRIPYTNLWDKYNTTRANDFTNFLFTDKCNMSYLQAVKPDYLLINEWWTPNLEYFNGSVYNANTPKEVNYNQSNLNYFLTSNSSLNCTNINLSLIYNKNYTKIYKVYS